MIKEIIKDEKQLVIGCTSITTKGSDTTEMQNIVKDLLDTAESNKWNCLGLAANQIGYHKRIIVTTINKSFVVMVNPQINPHGKKVTKEESCLSFPGKWVKMKRYYKVKVSYFDPINMIQVPCLKLKHKEARIIQHEMDHLNGKLI